VNFRLLKTVYFKDQDIYIYRTIVLHVVLYGCETWSLTLREERKLRAFKNKALRRMFGSRRDEVTGEWRRLHNEKLNDLYSSPNIVRAINSRRMRNFVLNTTLKRIQRCIIVNAHGFPYKLPVILVRF